MSHVATIALEFRDPAALATRPPPAASPPPRTPSPSIDGTRVTGTAMRLPGWRYPVVIDAAGPPLLRPLRGALGGPGAPSSLPSGLRGSRHDALRARPRLPGHTHGPDRRHGPAGAEPVRATMSTPTILVTIGPDGRDDGQRAGRRRPVLPGPHARPGGGAGRDHARHAHARVLPARRAEPPACSSGFGLTAPCGSSTTTRCAVCWRSGGRRSVARPTSSPRRTASGPPTSARCRGPCWGHSRRGRPRSRPSGRGSSTTSTRSIPEQETCRAIRVPPLPPPPRPRIRPSPAPP